MNHMPGIELTMDQVAKNNRNYRRRRNSDADSNHELSFSFDFCDENFRKKQKRGK